MADQRISTDDSVSVHSALNQVPDSVQCYLVWQTICGKVRVKKLTALGSGRSEPPGTAVSRRPAGPALDCLDIDNMINYVLV